MKFRLVIILIISFSLIENAMATSTGVGTRNILIDGIVNIGAANGSNGPNWEANEEFVGFSSFVNWYATWDNTNLYIGKIKGSNTEASVLYLRSEFLGATYSVSPQTFDTYNPDFSLLNGTGGAGINFCFYFKQCYNEFRTFSGGSWSAANTTLAPVFTTQGTDTHMEVAIPWNLITNGNGKPNNVRFLLSQLLHNTVSNCLGGFPNNCGGTQPFVYGESPWGNGTLGSPTIGVNDGVATSTLPQPGGCVAANATIQRWWGCYPVIAGVGANGWIATQPNVKNEDSLCELTATYTLKGNAPSALALGNWVAASSNPSAVIITQINDSTATTSGFAVYGNYDFYYSINYNSCPAPPDTLTLHVFQSPSVSNAGADIFLCETDSVILNGNIPVVGNGTWSLITGVNIGTSATFANPSLNNTKVNNLSYGRNTFLWKIDNGSCFSMDTINVYRYAQPIATTSNALNFCGATIVNLVANDPSLIDSTVIGTWTLVNAPLTMISDSSLFSTNVSGLTSSATGKLYVYNWTVLNGVCTSASINDSITIFDLITPVISNFNDTSFCTGDSVLLVSNYATGNTWQPLGQTNDSIFVFNSTIISVTVVGAGGCSGTSSNINIIENPNPITPIITSSGPASFCAGNFVTLSYNSANVNTWHPSNLNGNSINVNTADTFWVTNTDINGCFSNSATFITTVNAIPAVPTITPDDGTTFCLGDSVHLTCSPALHYAWLPSGDTTQVLTVFNAGLITVQITDVNGCQNTSLPTLITVNTPATPPSISSSGPTTFCNGGNVILSSSSLSGNIWSPGNLNTNSINVTTSGSYTVSILDINACLATSTPVQVIVNPLPNQPVITAGGPTTVCAGTTVFIASSNASNYLWSPGGQVSQTISITNSGTFSVATTNSFGCTNTSLPITITVNPIPPTPIITASGPTTFCEGTGGVVLTSSAALGNIWNPTGNNNSAISVNTSGFYSVQIADNGCNSAFSNVIQVIVNPKPIVSVVANSNPICEGETLLLGASGGINYTWSPNTFVDTTFAANLIAHPTTPVTYIVTGFDGNGCSNFDFIAIDVIKGEIPKAGADFTSCEAFIPLQAINSNGVWSSPNTSIIYSDRTAPNCSVSNLSIGNNILIWNNKTPCSKSDTVIVEYLGNNGCEIQMPTGITPNKDGKNDKFVIRLKNDGVANNLFIYNRWGNIVYQTDNYNNDWEGTNQAGDELPDGTYFVIFKQSTPAKEIKGYLDVRRK
jgi:gliding motility-associated-like protein